MKLTVYNNHYVILPWLCDLKVLRWKLIVWDEAARLSCKGYRELGYVFGGEGEGVRGGG